MAKDICALLGDRIKQLRTERGWRQIDLAEHAGIHENSVSNAERGTNEVTLGMLQALAKALGMSSSDLLKGLD